MDSQLALICRCGQIVELSKDGPVPRDDPHPEPQHHGAPRFIEEETVYMGECVRCDMHHHIKHLTARLRSDLATTVPPS